MTEHIFVPEKDYQLAISGDASAIERLGNLLDGVVIYDHAFIPPDEWGAYVHTTYAQLEDIGVLQSMTLHKGLFE